jgi:adenosylmethionine-8-amino-7-oxononanoate aminotransferase
MPLHTLLYPNAALPSKAHSLNIVRGKKQYLYDQHGKVYLDCNSGLWNVPLGYGVPTITDAISRQAEKLCYINQLQYTTPVIENYAAELVQFVGPHYATLFYSLSGSESIEVAVKLARQYQSAAGHPEKKRILTMNYSFHGMTYAAMTASGCTRRFMDRYAPLVPLISMIEIPFSPSEPLPEEEKQAYLDKIDQAFATNDIAAVILEPVICSGGLITLPPWFSDHLFKKIDESAALLIADEVATGFGRTGQLFKSNSFLRKPDLLCLAKAITNGSMPLAVTLLSKDVAGILQEKESEFIHLSTQSANPVTVAAALATLNIFQDHPQYIKDVQVKSQKIALSLQKTLGDLPSIRDIRIEGLIVAIDLVQDEKPIDFELSIFVVSQLEKQGLLATSFTLPSCTAGIILMPPFVINDEDIEWISTALQKVLINL